MSKLDINYSFSIRDITDLSLEEEKDIRTFISSCNKVTPFQTFEWNLNLSNNTKKQVKILLISYLDQLCSITFFDFKRKYLFLKYFVSPVGNMGYGGPLISDLRPLEEVKKIFINHIFSEKSYYNITLPPSTSFVDKRIVLEKHKTSILNTSLDYSLILENFKKDCRRVIRKAENSELKYDYHYDSFLTDFFDILKINYEKKNVNLHSFNFYKGVFDNLPKKQRFLGTVSKDGNCIAGAVILLNRAQTRAYYWLGSSLQEYNKYHPNNFLQSKIINDLSKLNVEEYDMLNLSIPSIARFKRSFGGTDYDNSSFTIKSRISRILNKRI